MSRYRTLGVWLTAEISIFFKPSYGGYTSESVSGTAGLPTTVLT
ncbi:unknown [Bifidobacterium bifidum CAG:234]|nr:unknown [Bifidobacterium bifidum CAG:234]